MENREPEIVIRLRKELAEFSRRAFYRGLVSGAGGNISVRIPHTDTVLITPTGISLGDVEPEGNLLVNLERGDSRKSVWAQAFERMLLPPGCLPA